MGREVISPKIDIVFKKFFTENLDLLKDFIAGILEIPVDSISELTVQNNEVSPETLSGKLSRLDLRMTVDDMLVNVEIQVNNDPCYRDRSMFYWSKLFTSELGSGEEYSNLKNTITVNILNYILFPDRESYCAEIVPKFKDTNEIFYDKFHIYFFELKKIDQKISSNSRRELWLRFIKADKEEDFNMLNNTNDPVMKKAVSLIFDMSEETTLRENARLREKALHDEASLIAAGRAEERARIIANLKAMGLSLSDIEKAISTENTLQN